MLESYIQHAQRKLAFHGDFGCSILKWPDLIKSCPTDFSSPASSSSRLNGSISNGEEGSSSNDANTNAAQGQLVDDDFIAYVWSIFVRKPWVCVGLVPAGEKSVYIPVKGSKAPVRELDPVENWRTTPYATLKEIYGSTLHIAVDAKTVLFGLTGGHARAAWLSEAVYAALMIIARAGEDGIVVDKLTKALGIAPGKTFYLTKTLIEHGIIIKRRTAGYSANVVIHRYFWENSPLWQSIHQEEARILSTTTASTSTSKTSAKDTHNDNEDVNSDDDDDDEDDEGTPDSLEDSLMFDPIDARFLSSSTMTNHRIVEFLRQCEGHVHEFKNMLISIGCIRPTRSDRRFFRIRVIEAVEAGLIEKVFVRATGDGVRSQGRGALCLRLVEQDAAPLPDKNVTLASDQEIDEVEQESLNIPLWNRTVHRQITDIIAEAGPKGATMKSITHKLSGLDRREIEYLLERNFLFVPSPHLLDLGVKREFVNYGRERRNEYWTFPNFKEMLVKNNLDHETHEDIMSLDMSHVGGWREVDEKALYDDPKDYLKINGRDLFPTKKIGRPRKHPLSGEEEDGKSQKKRRPPLDGEPVVKRKRGRPRKSETPAGASSVPAKRQRPEDVDELDYEDGDDALPTPGPSKRPRRAAASKLPSTSPELELEIDADIEPPPPPVKLSRPRKNVDPDAPKRPRGRPRKTPAPVPAENEDIRTPAKRGRPPRHTVPPIASERDSPQAADATSAVKTRRTRRSLRSTVAIESEEEADPDEEEEKANEEGEKANEEGEKADEERKKANDNEVETRGDGAEPDPLQGCDEEPGADSDAARNVSGEPDGANPPTGPSSVDPQAPAQPAAEPATGPASEPATESAVDPADRTHAKSTAQPTDMPASQDQINQASTQNGPQPSSEAGPSTLTAPSPAPEVSKHSTPDNPIIKARSKKQKTADFNSQLRRNEILAVLAELGGLANIYTKRFVHYHGEYLERMVAAGEKTSAPAGTRIDRKTMTDAINELENQGKIRTTVLETGSLARPCKVAALASVTPEQEAAFFANIGEELAYRAPTYAKEVIEGFNIKNHKSDKKGSATPGPMSKSGRLKTTDPEELHDLILAEQNVILQSCGYITGSFARARELHLFLAHTIAEGETASPFFISKSNLVFATEYLWTEIPVAMYFSLIRPNGLHPELVEYLSHEENRWVPIQSIPKELYDAARVDRWKSRNEFHTLLGILITLGVLTPLKVTDSTTSYLQCDDVASPDVSSKFSLQTEPSVLPTHCACNISVPIFLLGASDDKPAPYSFTMDVPDNEARKEYWDLVKVSALHPADSGIIAPEDSSRVIDDPVFLTASRKQRNWASEYHLSYYQKKYLESLVDYTTATNALTNKKALDDACFVTTAPADIITTYVNECTKQAEAALRRIKSANEPSDSKEARVRRNRAEIGRQVRKARNRFDKQWRDSVAAVHPIPLTSEQTQRLALLKKTFLDSNTFPDQDTLMTTIRNTLSNEFQGFGEFTMPQPSPGTSTPIPTQPRPHTQAQTQTTPTATQSTAPITSKPSRTTISPAIVYPNKVSLGPGYPSVISLVEAQSQRPPERKRVRKKAENTPVEETPKGPTTRFRWTDEYQELCQDACIIMYVRCDGRDKRPYEAIKQLFPGVSAGSVRSHCTVYNKAIDSYTERLRSAWSDLWHMCRGTDELPDEDPAHPTEFDMIKHVQFLRDHIDKDLVRREFGDEGVIPAFVAELQKEYCVSIKQTAVKSAREKTDDNNKGLPYDFVFGFGDEAREKPFRADPFVLRDTNNVPFKPSPSLDVGRAKGIIKMDLSTPDATFDERIAKELLDNVPEDKILLFARDDLNEEEVIAQTQDAVEKPRPGRAYRYRVRVTVDEAYSHNLFDKATGYDEELSTKHEDWDEWPLIVDDAAVVAYIQALSEDKLDVSISLPNIKKSHKATGGNSRKIDDEHLESIITFRHRPLDEIQPPQSLHQQGAYEPIDDLALPSTPAEPSPDNEHRKRYDESPGSCFRDHQEEEDGGCVDCIACLKESLSTLISTLPVDSPDHNLIERRMFLQVIDEAGWQGRTVSELTKEHGFEVKDVYRLATISSQLPVPLLFWGGYASPPVLVSSRYLSRHAVKLPLPPTQDSAGDERMEDPLVKYVFPRKWRDIRGDLLENEFKEGLRALTGWAWARPGLPETDLRFRLKKLYDRQEFNELLSHLWKNKILVRTVRVPHVKRDEEKYLQIGSTTAEEEMLIFWSVAENVHWYTVGH